MDIDSKKMESETNIKVSSVSSQGSVISDSLRQQLTEKEHLKDITAKLVILVNKKKNLHKLNRRLQQERDTIERERANSFADFTKTNEERLNNLTCEKEFLKQKLEVMQRQIDEADTSKQHTEKKHNQLNKDKDAYIAELAEARKILATEEHNLKQRKALFEKLEREKNELINELTSYKKQNSKLKVKKSELEEKIKSNNEASDKIKLSVEQLRLKLTTQEDLLVAKSAKKRQLFEREKADLLAEFEKKQIVHQKEMIEKYERDKEVLIKESKTRLESIRQTLNETKQKLQEEVKVLEDQNEEYQTNVRNLTRMNGSMVKKEEIEIKRIREKSTQEYEEMERKYQADIAISQKNAFRLEKTKKELELELVRVKEAGKRKIEELKISIKQHQQQNEKIKQQLNEKDSVLTKLQQEHVDYFQEINTLQRLIASADETIISAVDDKLMDSTRPTKKPRL